MNTIAIDNLITAWTTCPGCWGQRLIYEDPNGEGLIPAICPTCLGIGERFH